MVELSALEMTWELAANQSRMEVISQSVINRRTRALTLLWLLLKSACTFSLVPAKHFKNPAAAAKHCKCASVNEGAVEYMLKSTQRGDERNLWMACD